MNNKIKIKKEYKEWLTWRTVLVITIVILMIGVPLYVSAATQEMNAQQTANTKMTSAPARVKAPGSIIYVNTFDDELNYDGDCSLREAVEAANVDDTIDHCEAGTGYDEIFLQAGVYTLSIGGLGEDWNQTGDLDILSDVNLIGDGSGQTFIDGNHIDTILHLADGMSMQLWGITLYNGGIDNGAYPGCINSKGRLSLYNSTVRDCFSPGNGGGVGSFGTLTNIVNTTISNNISEINGGGMFATNGTVNIWNSTFSGNTAYGHGGGMSINNADVTMNNVTVANNTADEDMNGAGDGGGIMVAGGTTNFSNTIIAGNSDWGNQAPDCYLWFGTFQSLDYNLIQNTAGCGISGTTTHNLTGMDPHLGSLDNYGGPTDTHPLLTGSPAIDAGNPAPPGEGGVACEEGDQRWETRPIDGDGDSVARCDIGAYEAEEYSGPTPTFTPTPTQTSTPEPIHPVLNRYTFAEGGGTAEGVNVTLRGSIAQASVIGETGGDVLHLSAGFWHAGGTGLPRTSTGLVSPGVEGSLESPDKEVGLSFLAGSVSKDTVVTYIENQGPGGGARDPEDDAPIYAGKAFTIEAQDADGPVTQFLKRYTLTVSYADRDWQMAGIADENSLNLYRRAPGSVTWVPLLPCNGCSHDVVNNQITVKLNRTNEFALFGEKNMLLFLPIVYR